MEYTLCYIKLGYQSVTISFSLQLEPASRCQVFNSRDSDPVSSSAVYINVLGKPYQIVRDCVPVLWYEYILVAAYLDRVIREVHCQKQRLQRLVLISATCGYAH